MNQEAIPSKDKKLIQVKNLCKYYPVRSGLFQKQAWVRAVDNVTLDINEGETLGVVGESGCGKTTLGRTMLRLIEPTSGEILFDGKDLNRLPMNKMKEMRRQMQVIFQDPLGSLSPRMPIGEQVVEGLRIHGIGTQAERNEVMIELLKKVGLEKYHAFRYPHEFSGGQLQRVGIARALALRPKFILCDEPVSALDVSIQSQVLNILKDLQEEFGLTYLFIAHNLNVVEHISHRVAVMYLGKVVELTSRHELYTRPMHPYTQAILSAIPLPDPELRRKRTILAGDVPSPVNPPKGCHFHPRCPIAKEICKEQEPELKQYGTSSESHFAACWRAGDVAFL
jgi:oligopeptide/dipeptide ABC transporter ATP-binding protein